MEHKHNLFQIFLERHANETNDEEAPCWQHLHLLLILAMHGSFWVCWVLPPRKDTNQSPKMKAYWTRLGCKRNAVCLRKHKGTASKHNTHHPHTIHRVHDSTRNTCPLTQCAQFTCWFWSIRTLALASGGELSNSSISMASLDSSEMAVTIGVRFIWQIT